MPNTEGICNCPCIKAFFDQSKGIAVEFDRDTQCGCSIHSGDCSKCEFLGEGGQHAQTVVPKVQEERLLEVPQDYPLTRTDQAAAEQIKRIGGE